MVKYHFIRFTGRQGGYGGRGFYGSQRGMMNRGGGGGGGYGMSRGGGGGMSRGFMGGRGNSLLNCNQFYEFERRKGIDLSN